MSTHYSALFLDLHQELIIQLLFPPTAHSDDIWWLKLVSTIQVVRGQSTYFLPQLDDLFKEKRQDLPTKTIYASLSNTENILVHPVSNVGWERVERQAEEQLWLWICRSSYRSSTQ